jgi:hypothetical protein
MEPAFPSLEELDLDLHNTNNVQCRQQLQVSFVRKHLTQNQMQLFYKMEFIWEKVLNVYLIHNLKKHLLCEVIPSPFDFIFTFLVLCI